MHLRICREQIQIKIQTMHVMAGNRGFDSQVTHHKLRPNLNTSFKIRHVMQAVFVGLTADG
jgi:hypothetical protein